MRNPINLSHIFRFSPTWNVEWNSEKECVTIDDFYEDPDAINDGALMFPTEAGYSKELISEKTKQIVDLTDLDTLLVWPYENKEKEIEGWVRKKGIWGN